MAKIELKNLTKSYGGHQVIKGVDLEIRKGEFMVFVGPSGCGKSTLLRLISGLEDITSGEMLFDGARVNDVLPSKRGIAMVFQSYALYPHMTVYENMAFGMKLAKSGADAIKSRVTEAAKMLQIDHLLDRLPKQLSGGQRQRVAIGRAITRDPRVFLFDEPLSNLDAALRVQTRLEIAKLHHEMSDVTMVYVTHDQVEAMTLASRIVVLAGGGVAQVGAPLELYERPRNEFVAQFIGSPSMNLLGGTIAGTGSVTSIALDNGGQATSNVPTTAADLGLRVNIGVRPEDLTPVTGAGVYTGEVEFTEALGEVTLLYFKRGPQMAADAAQMVAKLPGIHAGLRHSTVSLSAAPEKVHLFAGGESLLYR